MKQLVPYLNFNGRCAEALAFYEACFGEADVSVQRFSDGPEMGLPEEAKSLVMHAEFKSDGLFFMATDGQPGNPFEAGNNIHLSIALDDTDEQTRLFEALSEGGQVVMPLQETFWKARFGMLTDRFGIQWMMNVLSGDR